VCVCVCGGGGGYRLLYSLVLLVELKSRIDGTLFTDLLTLKIPNIIAHLQSS
jgi:hypothetical protein